MPDSIIENPYYRVRKQFYLTPVTEGVSPRAKDKAVVSDFRKLFSYLILPATFTVDFSYTRQLLFQYNIKTNSDFYLLNIDGYRALTRNIIAGGCLCVKWLDGQTVHRYKLFDHRQFEQPFNWSYFTPYTNQIVKSRFSFEFWGDELLPSQSIFNRGILQDLTFQTSLFYIPSVFEELPAEILIDSEPVEDLGFELPIAFPIHQDNLVFNTDPL